MRGHSPWADRYQVATYRALEFLISDFFRLVVVKNIYSQIGLSYGTNQKCLLTVLHPNCRSIVKYICMRAYPVKYIQVFALHGPFLLRPVAASVYLSHLWANRYSHNRLAVNYSVFTVFSATEIYAVSFSLNPFCCYRQHSLNSYIYLARNLRFMFLFTQAKA